MNLPRALHLHSNSGMCAAYTDRLLSFMHFHSDFKEKSYGLVQDETQLLKDFCFIENSQSLLTRASCIKMTARCGSLEFVFPSFSLFISLVFSGYKNPVLYIRFVPAISGIAGVHKGSLSLVLLCGKKAGCSLLKKYTTYHRSENVFLREASINEKKILVNQFVQDDCTPLVIERTSADPYELYLSFYREGDGPKEPENVKGSIPLIKIHRKKIEDFFSCFSFALESSNTDNCTFTSSLLWAQFSGWMMVTGIKDRGIWAGLPWFRDNWGRDTFIALPGILLVTGQFEEARSVIESFAKYQNTNRLSETYGRIPNRYRSYNDVLYNTADGTLWFIREVWEYAQYTGDVHFIKKMFPTVTCALEADRLRRTDEYGFLLHDDADTWMDARIDGKEPWSPRGSRACDIQALWYTALMLGSAMATLCGSAEYKTLWYEAAQKLQKSFHELFVESKTLTIADCIKPDGFPDSSLRPNQLFCITAPSVTVMDNHDKGFLQKNVLEKAVVSVFEKLTFPYGVLSLDQHHENFHPYHDSCSFYHKDAAYHNGTIWLWNSGPLIESMCLIKEQDTVYDLSLSHAKQMLPSKSTSNDTLPSDAENAAFISSQKALSQPFRWTSRCSGSLSENMDAYPSASGILHPSGTFSQAWSVSEFSRTAYQSYAGIHPCMLESAIVFSPVFPSSWKSGKITFKAGENSISITWITDTQTERMHFTVVDYRKHDANRSTGLQADLKAERQDEGTSKPELLKLFVYLAEKKEDVQAKMQTLVLEPGKECCFSGFIPRGKRNLKFASPLLIKANAKSIMEENFLYKKIKGTHYE